MVIRGHVFANGGLGGFMVKNDYLMIHVDVLPEVFTKVIEVKELLRANNELSVAEAVGIVGISRSTFYKYNDFVFTLTDGLVGKKATISMILSHHLGVLSKILEVIAKNKGNILTISQSIPIENKASVTITFDISEMSTTLSSLNQEIQKIEGVYKFVLEAIES
jgi:chorismate mutase